MTDSRTEPPVEIQSGFSRGSAGQHRSNPPHRPALYAAASRIGRDHLASTVNTLVLAFSAAALPLLLLYTQSGLAFGEILTNETIAVEIVQTLVGSIGLVASVPITTALACWVITRSDTNPTNHHRPHQTARSLLSPSTHPTSPTTGHSSNPSNPCTAPTTTDVAATGQPQPGHRPVPGAKDGWQHPPGHRRGGFVVGPVGIEPTTYRL